MPLLAAAIVIRLWTIDLLVSFPLSRRVGVRLMAGMLVVAVLVSNRTLHDESLPPFEHDRLGVTSG